MNFAGVPARAAAAVVIGGWSISPSRSGGHQNPSYFSLTTAATLRPIRNRYSLHRLEAREEQRAVRSGRGSRW
jgi:hypothetical protein